MIALVQPGAGGTVPRDKPVVVFRFARGEAADPVNIATFRVTVNGADRTADFQVTSDEAWGPLTNLTGPDSLTAQGPHAITARVCSVRGACAEATNTVVAIDPSAAGTTSPESPAQSKSTRARVVELLLDAVRKLVVR